MDIRAIRDEADYDWALSEIEQYFDEEPARGSPEADRFDVLATLIAAYEAGRWNIEAPDPVAAIQSTMELQGRKQSDLAKLFGSRSRASEVLNRQRPLTLGMINKLRTEWHMPAEILVRPYGLTTRSGRAGHRS